MPKEKKVFLLLSVCNSGSGSLTWPEDFDLKAVYEDEGEADAEAERLNDANGVSVNDDDEDDDYECDDEDIYEVHPLTFVKKK